MNTKSHIDTYQDGFYSFLEKNAARARCYRGYCDTEVVGPTASMPYSMPKPEPKVPVPPKPSIKDRFQQMLVDIGIPREKVDKYNAKIIKRRDKVLSYPPVAKARGVYKMVATNPITKFVVNNGGRMMTGAWITTDAMANAKDYQEIAQSNAARNRSYASTIERKRAMEGSVNPWLPN